MRDREAACALRERARLETLTYAHVCVTGKLRARLESAKGILKNLTEALVETKERLVDLEMQLSRSPRAY